MHPCQEALYTHSNLKAKHSPILHIAQSSHALPARYTISLTITAVLIPVRHHREPNTSCFLSIFSSFLASVLTVVEARSSVSSELFFSCLAHVMGIAAAFTTTATSRSCFGNLQAWVDAYLQKPRLCYTGVHLFTIKWRRESCRRFDARFNRAISLT